jgi:hypothetical protein
MGKRTFASTLLAAGAWALSSCAPGGFRDETVLQGVRILASRAEPAYAKPGESVQVDVLAYDGRPSQPAPMSMYWVPTSLQFVCENPPDDAYYFCFQQFARIVAAAGGSMSGSSGAPAGLGAGAGLGVGASAGCAPGAGDTGPGLAGLLPYLHPGVALPVPRCNSFVFTMPADAVTSHPPVAGTPVPYGLAVLFNVACAGHLELLPVDPANDNPVQVPVGCFDDQHKQLGPDDYVIGITRVYAFDTLRNANPIIDHIDVEGQPVDLSQGFTTPPCTATGRNGCAKVHLGPVVPPESWEPNPELRDENGNQLHEEIWADFYSTFGQFNDSARLLYDAAKGSLGDPSVTNNQWQPPGVASDGFLFIVVHDSRGGAAWVQVPVHVH